MNCFYCGEELGDADVCPTCGTGQQIYRKILSASDAAYNDGLYRAGIRDLSGAADALNLSLKYNKYHTRARNLLGLVYFEVGETVLALREWVISKNLQPENNGADAYLEDMERTGTLKRLDQTTRKFNQALAYCRQGSRDLARIQLRRVLSANPKMIKAHQLLALISMQDGKYEDARKSLSAASKIDYKNPMTMEYSRDVRETLKEKGRHRRRRNRDTADFTENNDSALSRQHTSSVFNVLDSTGSGIINVFVGIILGVLACVFLVMPSMRQDMNLDAASALVNANEEAANSKNNVATLNKQVESLTAELEEYTGRADVKTSYEELLQVEDAIASGDMDLAKKVAEDINPDLLDEAGQARYAVVAAAIDRQVVAENYEAGVAAMREEDYAKAAELLAQVVLSDAMYDTGNALFYLAQSCERAEQYQNALDYYQEFVDNYPSTRRASTARSAINTIVAQTGLSAPIPADEREDVESDEMTDGAEG